MATVELREAFMPRLAATVLASAIALSSPALAGDLYWGGGIAYTSGTSDNVTGGDGSSDLSAGMLTVILGQRFASGTGFFGWEASADPSLGAGAESTANGTTCAPATGSYLCTHDATVRVVGQYGMAVGEGTEVFGSLGVGVLKGDFATSPATSTSAQVSGLTLGLGLNRDYGNGLTFRGEVIHDNFTNFSESVNASEYSGTSVRLALLRKF
jgi:hypothetical protein